MGILQLPTPLPSQVGLLPATKKMVTTDSLATITTAGYLNAVNLESYPLAPSDILEVLYSYSQQTNSGTYGLFTVGISNGVITLSLEVNPGNVLLPVVSGDFAVFNGTTGQIKDSGSLPSAASQPFVVVSPGSLTAGNFPQLNDVNGTLKTGLPPSATGQAFVVMSPGSLTSGQIPKFNDVNGTLANSGILAVNVAISSLTSPDAASDIIWYDITATAAALATAGKVNIQVSSGSKQYCVRNVLVNLSTGLSGGGGDRLLSISDSTHVWNSTGITAALLGTAVNTVWGGTGNPLPATPNSFSTQSTAGANIFLQYVGGTTDYTTGSVIISVAIQRVV